MENKIENENNSRNTNNIKRFVLLVLFPSLIILFTIESPSPEHFSLVVK